MARNADPDAPIVIKKYANRRLYNTATSSYITLDHLAQLVRDGREFKVLDARTDEDLTHSVLTQIIVENEAKDGGRMLPASFLRDIIAMYGNSMRSVVPGYLEASMDALRRNQAQMQDVVASTLSANPLAAMARANMELFQAATSAFAPPRPSQGSQNAEIEALKAEVARLREELAKRG